MRMSQPFLRWCQWACLVGALVPMSGCRSGTGMSRVPGFGWLAKNDDFDRDGWASYADGPSSLAAKDKDSAEDDDLTEPRTEKTQESKSEMKVAQLPTGADAPTGNDWSQYPTTKTPDPYPGTTGSRSASLASNTPAGSAAPRTTGTQQGFYDEPVEPSSTSPLSSPVASPATPAVAQAPSFPPPADGPPPFIPQQGSPESTSVAGTANNPFGPLPPPPGPAPRVGEIPGGVSGEPVAQVADNRALGSVSPPMTGALPPAASSPSVPGMVNNPYVTQPNASPATLPPTSLAPGTAALGTAAPGTVTPGLSSMPPAAGTDQPAPRSAQPWAPGSTGRSLTPTPPPQQNPWGAAPTTTPPGTSPPPMVPGRLSQQAMDGATVLAVSDEFPARLWR